MLEKNTKQVNAMIARIFMCCSGLILVMVACSLLGIFEFGRTYTWIVLIAGLVTAISPSLLIRVLPDHVLKYSTLVMAAVFIGILGINDHIGIYISYVLVPLLSCLYFEPDFVVKTGVFSYAVMAVSLYFGSFYKHEVLDLGMPRMHIFIAYLLGFTIEYLIAATVFYNLVKRARNMMEKCYSAEEENRMKTRVLSSVSHEIRTPMHAILGMAEVAMREDMSPKLRRYLGIIRSSAAGLLELIDGLLVFSRFEEPEPSAAGQGEPAETGKEGGLSVPEPDAWNKDPICSAEVKGAYRVLIVDDNEINREVLKALLEPYHFIMDEAENGQEAVTMAEKQQYGMIFMDSQMPVMSGKEACRAIRRRELSEGRHTPIVAITADAIAGVREELLAGGMDEYISKPVDSKKLAAVIEQYLCEAESA